MKKIIILVQLLVFFSCSKKESIIPIGDPLTDISFQFVLIDSVKTEIFKGPLPIKNLDPFDPSKSFFVDELGRSYPLRINYNALSDQILMILAKSETLNLVDEIQLNGQTRNSWLVYWVPDIEPDTIVFETTSNRFVQYSSNFILRNNDTIFHLNDSLTNDNFPYLKLTFPWTEISK